MIGALVAAEILLIVAMAAGWVVQRRLNNAGWVDVFWTFGVGLAGILVAFWPVAGSGVVERRVVQAKEQGFSVVDRRGPLGTHPKRAAREAAAA